MRRRTELHTPRLLLRPVERRDIGPLMRCIDDVVMRAMGWRLRDLEEWRRFLGSRRWRVLVLAVVDKHRNLVVGSISAGSTVVGPKAISVGFSFGPEGRHRGFAIEACTVAIPYFFRLGAERIVIETGVDNGAMRTVAEAIGGRLLDEYDQTLPNGQVVPALRFELPRFVPVRAAPLRESPSK